MQPDPTKGTAAALYGLLEDDRQVFLQRARECAEYTIPMIFPPQGHSSSTRYFTPFQSLGARGVNNLASKLLLALLPPETCFFRLRPSSDIEKQLEQLDDQTPDGQVEASDLFDQALSDMEQKVLAEINNRGARVHSYEAFRQLIVGGNTLVFMPPDKGIRVFRLDQYVVKRDPSGDVLDIVVKEMISPSALPESIRDQVMEILDRTSSEMTDDERKRHKATVDVYTSVCRCDGHWEIKQEVKGIEIPESQGTYPLDKCPWLPLRWTTIDGENYGRGHCEEYIGDLRSLESLAKLIVEGSNVAGKILILVKPNGMTRVESLADKPNGAIVEGSEEDVTLLQAQKSMDFQFVANTASAIEQRLSFAFLLNSSVQREGERVTAEEIRYMAGELEDALGGVYSLLADDFQRPLAYIIMGQMERESKLPKLPKDAVHPTLVTGLDALGRSHELNRLDAFVDGALQKFGQQVLPYLDLSDYLSRRAAALGIKAKGLVKTKDVVKAEMQQQQQMQLANQVAPSAVQAGAKIQTQAMQNQAQAQQQQQENEQ